ncbi:MAG: hypothetical protein IIC91_14030, partial [Chloroflexi bacterium]|nr:hypothetical protein [Chloroflexota bacterium]
MFSRIPRLMIVVLSAALLVGLALVMDGSSLNNTAEAGTKPEMSLSANGPDVFCDSQPSVNKGDVPKPLKCDVPLGGTFTVSIEINTAPASGYDAWQTEIDYGALTYKKAASAADEIVPLCPGPFGATRFQSASVVVHFCGIEPGNKQHDTGNIVELEFNCTDSKSNNAIELLDPATLFFVPSPGDVVFPNVDSLGINCVNPPELSLSANGPGVTCDGQAS